MRKVQSSVIISKIFFDAKLTFYRYVITIYCLRRCISFLSSSTFSYSLRLLMLRAVNLTFRNTRANLQKFPNVYNNVECTCNAKA